MDSRCPRCPSLLSWPWPCCRLALTSASTGNHLARAPTPGGGAPRESGTALTSSCALCKHSQSLSLHSEKGPGLHRAQQVPDPRGRVSAPGQSSCQQCLCCRPLLLLSDFLPRLPGSALAWVPPASAARPGAFAVPPPPLGLERVADSCALTRWSHPGPRP